MVLPLPELPEQGQTPWFEEREGFDLAVKDELENRLSPAGVSTSVSTGIATDRTRLREPLNLMDYGAIGNGVADDTAAVQAWITAVRTSNPVREGYAPAGTYQINAPIVGTLVNRKITGAGQRGATTFRAGSAIARIFDFRQTLTSVFEDFAIDGNNLAQICFDLSWTPGAASSRISVIRVRTLNALDCGYFVDNLGDSIFDDCNAGPFPNTATVMHWSNQGGNSYIKNPTWFPAPGLTGEVTGGARAALEASFQNLKIEGGALMGIECLDGESSQTLLLDSVQMYPFRDGPNISGPRTSGALRMLTMTGSKMATHRGGQYYFGGRFDAAINLENCMLNSGAESGSPRAFGDDFAAGLNGGNTVLSMRGNRISSEAGTIPVSWNDSQPGLDRDYSGFRIGAVRRDVRDVMDIGTGVSGTGPRIGGGTRIRLFNSVTNNLDFPSTANGASSSINVTMTGTVPGNRVEVAVAPTTAVPSGVMFDAQVTSADTVRVTLLNFSGGVYDAPSMPVRIYLIAI